MKKLKILFVFLFAFICFTGFSQGRWKYFTLDDGKKVQAIGISDSTGAIVQDFVPGSSDTVNMIIVSPTDDSTSTLITIPYPYHEIIKCNTWQTWDNATIGDGSTRELLIETGADDYHTLFDITGTLETGWTLAKDATRTTGTKISSYNRCIGSSLTSTMTVSHTPGGSGNGTTFDGGNFGIDTAPQNKSGGVNRDNEEWILYPNSKYLIRVTSGTAGNIVNTRIKRYER